MAPLYNTCFICHIALLWKTIFVLAKGIKDIKGHRHALNRYMDIAMPCFVRFVVKG